MAGIITVSAEDAAASVVMERREVNARCDRLAGEPIAAFRCCTGRR